MKFLQKLGKSLMLPVAVLPICGILMGIGYRLCPEAIQGGGVYGFLPSLGYFLVTAGGAIINNMSWLFVVGVAVGMSDDNHGASALAGIVSWLIVTTLLAPSHLTMLVTLPTGSITDVILLSYDKIQNPFIGIITGLLGATCYNKFKTTKLPDFLAFFGGRRFVIIATAVASLILTALLFVLWPLLFLGLTYVGKFILGLGGIGAGIYAFLNRLLIPFGLHHALNNVFWFDTIGIGDLTNFWAGKTSADVGWSLGMYMSGFFPCVIFGIPGAALAMIKNAKNRKKAIGILLSAAVCAVICGVTEPFEFAFMFAAFPLYIVYSLLYGIFTVITYFTGFRAGFSFSSGIVDLIFSSSLPAAQKTLMLIPIGILAFAAFYLVFDLMIRIFKLKTPGRDDDGNSEDEKAAKVSFTDRERAYALLAAIGGKANVVNIDCCATRLRLQLANSSRVDKKACEAAGALGVVIPDSTSCQLIIGVTVQSVLEDVRSAMLEAEAPKRQTVAHGDTVMTVKGMTEKKKKSVASETTDGGFTFTVSDPLGIHARPASGIGGSVRSFDAEVTLTLGDRTANAKSVTEIMSLGVRQGDTLTVRTAGNDAAAASEALKKYLTENL